MDATSHRRSNPRRSLIPAILAFLLGLSIHLIDQALFHRAGPIPILLTAPVVATLVYLRFRDATRRRILALLVWGAVGSGIGVLGVYVSIVNYQLPRAMTDLEMSLYDLGMFLWFVLALAALYAIAAKRRDRMEIGLLLVAPIVQAAFSVVMRLLVVLGLYA